MHLVANLSIQRAIAVTGLVGWFGHPSEDTELLHRVSRHLEFYPGVKVHVVKSKIAVIGVVGSPGTFVTLQQGSLIGAVCGQFDWSDKHLAVAAQEQGPAAALALAWKRDGENLVSHLAGEFSIALYDESNGRGIVATDRVGIKPLYHAPLGTGLAFGSTADALREHDEIGSKPVVNQSIFNYLYYHHVPAPGTAFEGCRRLLPGGRICADASGGWRESEYWTVRYEPGPRRLSSDLKQEFLGLVEASVARFANAPGTGAFLSGGTDSSTVAGMMARSTQGAPKTFSIGFDEAGYDEMEYARIASRYFGTDHHEYYVTPEDIVSVASLIAEIYSEPFGNASAVPTFYCAQMARQNGVHRMLGGDGGDELFGGNSQYARQYLFSFYDRLPSFLRSGVFAPLARNKLLASVPVISKLHSYVRQASVPLPARLDTYNQLEQLGLTSLFTPDFLAQVDTSEPSSMRETEYESVHADHWLNKVLGRDLKAILADTDLPKVTRMCDAAGQEVSFPLLSDDLMEFAARLHPDLKLRRTRLRYFFKEALKEFLPPEIIVKPKQGFGLPIGPWLARPTPVQEMSRDLLADFRNRGIVNPDWLDTLTGEYLPSHPHYYGTIVWLLVILELWLSHRKLSL